MVIAGIGQQAGTTADRALRIALQRQPMTALGSPMDFDKLSAARNQICPALRAYGDTMADAMALSQPPIVFPNWLGSRDRDNWRPLIRVADLAGGSWPGRVQQAMSALCRDAHDRLSQSEQLLADIREFARERRLDEIAAYCRRHGRTSIARLALPPLILDPKAPSQPLAKGRPYRFLVSGDLAAWLMDKDDSPLAKERDQGAAKNRVAALLRGFGIRPAKLNAGRGYPLNDLRRAWGRYL